MLLTSGQWGLPVVSGADQWSFRLIFKVWVLIIAYWAQFRVLDDFDQWSVGLTNGHFAPFSFVSMTNGYSGLFNCYKYIRVVHLSKNWLVRAKAKITDQWSRLHIFTKNIYADKWYQRNMPHAIPNKIEWVMPFRAENRVVLKIGFN